MPLSLLEFRPAHPGELETYFTLARAAQAWLLSQGLKQYIPAAHDLYADAMRARIESGTLFAVDCQGQASAFFGLDAGPSQWWPEDGMRALYLAGMVVAQESRGRGVGVSILRWCLAEAGHRGFDWVRLDCHAGNPWLCRYYESHGFAYQGHVQMHPGYDGCLFQHAAL